LIGVGAALVAGVPVALRRRFSAREFDADVARYGATATLYIGELCRALVRTPVPEGGVPQALRVAVGNGLDSEIWAEFQRRLGGAQIREFYASTEAPSAILNLTGEPGSLGHVPFERARGFRLVRLDAERVAIARGADGFACECAADEPGELLLRLEPNPDEPLGAFRGYTDAAASAARVVQNVFESGDAYFRSADLLRRDARGYFYFVDRLGDSYRWKGENVSTLEVERVLRARADIEGVSACGVTVPGHSGRAGFVEVVCKGGFDPARFAEAAAELPAHARPCFVRVVPELELTSTLKLKKRPPTLAPNEGAPDLWVKIADRYVVLTAKVWDDLCCGRARL